MAGVRLILFHPGPARISCEQCLKFIHDMETGEIKTYKATVDGERKDLPCVRPKNTMPPCGKCPKQSPEKAKEHELTFKNWKVFAHYRESRAVGLTEKERRDPIIRRNQSIIDRLMREFDAKRQAKYLAIELAALMPR